MDPPADTHWPKIAAIIRQHAHDIRNYINSLDLDATMLGEVLTDEVTARTVARMRRQTGQLEAAVNTLCVKFFESERSDVPVLDLIQLWKNQVEALPAPPKVEWLIKSCPRVMAVDVNAVVVVLRELIVIGTKSAVDATIVASVRCEDEVIFEVRYPARRAEEAGSASSPSAISRERRQRLGLDWIVERNGGRMSCEPRTAAGECVTTLRFPFRA
jgi:hypothetical protein